MLEEVRLLTAGFCLHPEAMTLRGASWSACEFPAGFALIYHARFGAILFDTGYSDHFRQATRGFPNKLYAMLTPPKLDDCEHAYRQLTHLGIAPADVRTIVISHFHSDHIAGLRDFPKARIICSKKGWQSVEPLTGISALLKGFLPELMPADVEQRILFTNHLPTVALPSHLAAFGTGCDILGDGTLVAIELPGHTASQLGLLINAPGRQIFLIADAAWSLKAVETATPPPSLTTDFLGETKIYRQTLKKLSLLRQTTPELFIFPAHVRSNFSILKEHAQLC